MVQNEERSQWFQAIDLCTIFILNFEHTFVFSTYTLELDYVHDAFTL